VSDAPQTFYEYQAAHACLHLGTYFSKDEDLGDGVHYLSSERITDSYWNYAYGLSERPDHVAPQIADVRSYAKRIDRPAAIAVDAASSLGDADVVSGAEMTSEEVWMLFTNGDLPDAVRAEDLEFRLIESGEEMALFLDVFEDAYGEGDPGSPGYSGLPDEYPDSLRQASPREDVSVVHVLCCVGGEPAAIASVYCKPPYAGLYNVGTKRRARRRGLGSAVSAAAMRAALDRGVTAIFLQTEPESEVEELYTKLGFERVFVCRVIDLGGS
jgi:ribosomal protein S18 acetylase RimI-like enzyme